MTDTRTEHTPEATNPGSGLKKVSEISYRFGAWHIYFEPPPIPCRNSDWHFYHEDYDGAPDANDGRAGHAESVDGCLREIREIEEWEEAARAITRARQIGEAG